MSYDISIGYKCDKCGNAKSLMGTNYTYNVAPMFRLALGGDGMPDLHGKKCVDVVDQLERAVAHMERFPDRYLPLNPPNGWGDYEGALRIMREILETAHNAYSAEIEIS